MASGRVNVESRERQTPGGRVTITTKGSATISIGHRMEGQRSSMREQPSYVGEEKYEYSGSRTPSEWTPWTPAQTSPRSSRKHSMESRTRTVEQGRELIPPACPDPPNVSPISSRKGRVRVPVESAVTSKLESRTRSHNTPRGLEMAPLLDHFQRPQEVCTGAHRRYPPSENMVVAAEEDDDVRDADRVIRRHYDQLREYIPEWLSTRSPF